MRIDTLPHLFIEKVTRFGDRVALREKDFGVWQEISWNDYARHVQHFCLGLIELGMKPADHVSIFGHNKPEWLYADLAIQSASAVAVGIYPTNPAPEAKYVIEHSDSIFVICDEQEQVDKILEVKDGLPLLKKIIVMDMKGLRHYDDPLIMSFTEVEKLGEQIDQTNPKKYPALLEAIDPNSVAIMVYTSGTTGPPKGAMISHDNVIQLIKAQSTAIPQSEHDEVVSFLPLCHVAERMMSVFMPLGAGSTVNFAESVDTVVLAMREVLPTFYLAVPRIWEKMMASIQIKMKDATPLKQKIYQTCLPWGQAMAEAKLAGQPPGFGLKIKHALANLLVLRAIRKELGLTRVRIALSGAAPISPEVLKFFHTLGIEVLEGWGMTEETGIATFNRPGEVKLGSVGSPIPGVELKIADDGEILLNCPHIFVGYWKNPEATAETIQDGWLYTGDVGEIDDQGRLSITDRKKEIIITSGGKNISPSELENRLKCSLYINEAVVIGDQRKFLSALIQIEYENVAKWAQEQKLSFTTFRSLAQMNEVKGLITEEVNAANHEFAQVEKIKKFLLLEKELDHDDGEVTATLKLRRKAVNEKFSELIESMYQEAG